MYKKKSKTLCYLLALFLGGIGAHLFYVKKYKRGILYLLFCWTYIPIFLGWIDMLFIHTWIRDGQILQSNNGKDKNFIDDGKEVEKIADDKVNLISCEKKIEDLSNLSYNIENIILPKYAHLKTPEFILHSLYELKDNNKKKVLNNGFEIKISFSTSHTEFAKDSLLYRNTREELCEFKSLFKYWTTFRDLDEEQKRWYFYWRDRVLNGEYIDTDLSYIILFTYELLNYTFNEEAAFNVSMIERLYYNYKETQPNIEKYLPNWISDFLYELGEKEMSEEWKSAMSIDTNQTYEKIIQNNDSLDKIAISYWKPYIHNYRETEFFKLYKNKIYNVFKRGVVLLQKTYKVDNKDIIELWFNEEEVVYNKHLYASVIMARDVIKTEVRGIKHAPTKRMYDEITTLFRMSENLVRQINGEKRQLKIEESILPENLKELLIEEIKPQKNGKLNDRFKLVQKNNLDFGSESIPKPKEEVEINKNFNFDIGRITILNEQSRELQDIFREKGYEDEEVEELGLLKSVGQKAENIEKNNLNDITLHNSITSELSLDEEEGDFIKSLTDNEINFLRGFNSLKRNAKESNIYFKQNGMMAGTFISNINEKSNEYLGDNILEINDEYYEIYDDYETLINIIKEGVK